ncbi:MAG: hypothetical protein ACI4O9_08180 [Akkermansia sp.]
MSDSLVAQRAPKRGTAMMAAPAAGGNALFAAHQQGATGLAAVTSNEAVTQVMASIYIAKTFPRNLVAVTQVMQSCCSRPSLAAKAVYSYPRGGTAVQGPSIRLAEALMGAWGNMEAGWKEVGRHTNNKGVLVSECVAFAFDKETNVRAEIAFSVPHWRDKKGGGEVVREERDIYELCANMAARRRRACILAILPSWLVEEAMDLVNETLAADMPAQNITDTARKLEASFREFNVTREMIERKLGHSLEECTRGELVKLRHDYTAISDGYVKVSDIFPVDAAPAAAPMQAAVPPAKAPKAPKAAKPRPAAAELASEEPESVGTARAAQELLPVSELIHTATAEELAALDKLGGIIKGSGKSWAQLYRVCEAIGFSHPEGGAGRDVMARFAYAVLGDSEAINALEESGFVFNA